MPALRPLSALLMAGVTALAVAASGCLDAEGVSCPSQATAPLAGSFPGCGLDDLGAAPPLDSSAWAPPDLAITPLLLDATLPLDLSTMEVARDLQAMATPDLSTMEATQDLSLEPLDAVMRIPDATPPADLVANVRADADTMRDLQAIVDANAPRDLAPPADLAPCNATTCKAGCCSHGACVKPTPLLCGINGLVCVQCGGNQICALGICL